MALWKIMYDSRQRECCGGSAAESASPSVTSLRRRRGLLAAAADAAAPARDTSTWQDRTLARPTATRRDDHRRSATGALVGLTTE
ncbi:hypothetical protein [Streptomyces sp. NPDC093099]|uniref:hypothetical protein n=1 Tax=Streptomyces sp. NPDC093099 TaxID=3366028 RepID=UPI0037FABA28